MPERDTTEWLSVLGRGIIRSGAYVSCICLIAMLLIIFANVFLRYVFSNPLYWGDETMIDLMLLMVYAGFGFVLTDGAHIRVTVAFARLPIKVQRVIWVITSLLTVGYSAYLLYAMITLVRETIQIGTFSMTTRWPVYPWQLVIAIGLFILVVASVFLVVEKTGIALGIRKEKERKEEEPTLAE